MELFTEKLKKIPKAKKPRRRSKGYNYLMENVCLPTLNSPDKGVKINFDSFTMSELEQVIDDFYRIKFNQVRKIEVISELFEKCSPQTRKAVFL
jgi:hypothetical protein